MLLKQEGKSNFVWDCIHQLLINLKFHLALSCHATEYKAPSLDLSLSIWYLLCLCADDSTTSLSCASKCWNVPTHSQLTLSAGQINLSSLLSPALSCDDSWWWVTLLMHCRDFPPNTNLSLVSHLKQLLHVHTDKEMLQGSICYHWC